MLSVTATATPGSRRPDSMAPAGSRLVWDGRGAVYGDVFGVPQSQISGRPSSWAVTAPYGDVTAHDDGFAGIDAARGRLLGVDPVRRRLPDQARAACASVARRSCVSGIHNDEYLGYRRPEGRSGRRRGRPGLGPGSVYRDGALGRESAA